MLLMIDNYDSFTFNIVRYLRELGAEVRVERNDALTAEDVEAMSPERIVISPGPGTPDQAGVSLALVKRFAGRVPLLGICLGHQCIGQAFGARVTPAAELMHGKVSPVTHARKGLFNGLPTPLTATRYHSLALDPQSLPGELEVTAWTLGQTGELADIMAVRHRRYAVHGVQFHPESVLSEHGHRLLRNFLEQ